MPPNHATLASDLDQPANWSSGNAFVSGPGSLKFKSQAGQIEHSFCQRLATAATFFRKKLCCLGAITRR